MALTSVESLCNAARKQGWTVNKTTKHIQLVPPGSGAIVVIACTPSCPHAIKNTIARMRKSGFEAPR